MTVVCLRTGRLLGLAVAWCLAGPGAHAESAALQFCDRQATMSARQQDRLLRWAALAKAELERAGEHAVLVARSGLDLARIGHRYSHAGVALQANPLGAWAVRQLYYACDERRPRLFDQGLAGFLFGTDNPDEGYVLLLPVPREPAAELATVALDRPRALRLLAATYSANAHAFSVRYQNCNQWVAELMAAAWGGLEDGDDLRERAQQWLAAQHYEPSRIEVGSHWRMAAAGFVPWLRFDDHPQDDRFALQFRISMPASLEGFARERFGGHERVELCHRQGRVVIRRGGPPIAGGCEPAPGDETIELD